MLQRKRITSIKAQQFEICWALYISAFPANERRTVDYQTETMEIPNYHFDMILDLETQEVVGFIGWWEFEELRYIEHFATRPELRGKGYGREALELFIAESDKMLILEVEHPTDEITRRRIGFYERIGLRLNDHPYSHPSYRQLKDERVALHIMSYPTTMTHKELQHFIDYRIPQIHFRNYTEEVVQ